MLMKRVDWVGRSKVILWVLLLSPLGWMLWRGFQNQLGPDPVKAVVDFNGRWAFRFLLLSLTMTPLRLLTGRTFWVRYRRMLGLSAFFYAVLHIGSYVLLLYGSSWREVGAELVQRPYIVVGLAAFMLMVPLALTSTRGWQRRLGRRWVQLHRLVYPLALLVLIHFAWVEKLGFLAIWLYVLILFVLFFVRLLAYLKLVPLKK